MLTSEQSATCMCIHVGGGTPDTPLLQRPNQARGRYLYLYAWGRAGNANLLGMTKILIGAGKYFSWGTNGGACNVILNNKITGMHHFSDFRIFRVSFSEKRTGLEFDKQFLNRTREDNLLEFSIVF